MMKITFDNAKRLQTLADRKIDFEDAAQVFAGRTLTVEDNRFDYGEDRLKAGLAIIKTIILYRQRATCKDLCGILEINLSISQGLQSFGVIECDFHHLC